MAGLDLLTPRMSNQVRNNKAKETYEQLNSRCPRCKLPLVRKSIDTVLSPKFSFGGINGLSCMTDDSMLLVQQEAVSSTQPQNPAGRFLCFTSTDLSPAAEEEDSPPFNFCTSARAKMPDETGDDPIISTGINERKKNNPRANNNNMTNIRSELPYCIACQAYVYVASEGVISEQQKAIAELVDRMGVDDDETAFMSLYIADEADLVEREARQDLDNYIEASPFTLKELGSQLTNSPRQLINCQFISPCDSEVLNDVPIAHYVTSATKKILLERKQTERVTIEKDVAAEKSEYTETVRSHGPNDSEKNALTALGDKISDSFNEESAKIERREIIALAIGAKLVEGYRLTSIPCDTCGVPLLEQNGNATCVACPAMQSQATTLTRTSNDSEKNTWNALGDALSDSYNKASAKIERREIIAQAIGTKLVEGYRLTNTLCDICGVPLLEKNGNAVCIACPTILSQVTTMTRTQNDTSIQESAHALPECQGTTTGCQLNQERFPDEINESQHKEAFHARETYNEVTVQAKATELADENKDSGCKYCGSPCLEQDSNGECSECRAVLHEQGDSTKTSTATIATAADMAAAAEVPIWREEDHQENIGWWYKALPCSNFENNIYISEADAENREDFHDVRDNGYMVTGRDDDMEMQRQRMPILYEEPLHYECDNLESSQGQYVVSRTRTKKKSPKKQSKKKALTSSSTRLKHEETVAVYTLDTAAVTEYTYDDQQVNTDHHFWWVDAIAVEESRLEVIGGVPVSASTGAQPELNFDEESLNDEISNQEVSIEVERKDQSNKKGKFKVLLSGKTWESVSFESSGDASTQMSRKSTSGQGKDKPIKETPFKVLESRHNWGSLSFDSLDNSSAQQSQKSANHQQEISHHRALPKDGMRSLLGEVCIQKNTFQTDQPWALPSSMSPDCSLSLIEASDSVDQRFSGAILSNFSSEYKSFPHHPLQITNDATSRVPVRDSLDRDQQEKTSAEICRLLGCGWKMLIDENCKKCLMPMMQKNPGNILKCAACEVMVDESLSYKKLNSPEGFQLNSTLASAQSERAYAKRPPLSDLSSSRRSLIQSASSASLSNLGIGKKLLQNWSLVTSRTCECGGPMMKAPSTMNETCINPVCSHGKIHFPDSSTLTDTAIARDNYRASTAPSYANNEDCAILEFSSGELNTSMDLIEAASLESQMEYTNLNGAKSFAETTELSYESSFEKLQQLVQHSTNDRSQTANHDLSPEEGTKKRNEKESGRVGDSSSNQEDLSVVLQKVEAAIKKKKKKKNADPTKTAAKEGVSTQQSDEENKTIENKLKAQIDIAEFLTVQKQMLSKKNSDSGSTAAARRKTQKKRDEESNNTIVSKPEAQLEMADLLGVQKLILSKTNSDDSTEAETQRRGRETNTTSIESKLKAQIDMAEFLGSLFSEPT